MKILNKLTLKSLKLNKKRTIVSVIGIILSTALMIGVGLLMSSFRETLIKDAKANGEDHHATIINVDHKNLEILKDNKTIKKYSYYLNLNEIATVKIDGEDNYFKKKVVDSKTLSKINLIEGTYPKLSNEIILDKKLASKLNLHINDNFNVTEEVYNEKEIVEHISTYKLTGFYSSDINYGNVYSGYGLIPDDYKGLVMVKVEYNNIYKTRELTPSLAKQLGAEDIDYNSNLLRLYGFAGFSNVNKVMVTLMSILLGVLSVACIIVIYNSFAISVMERKKQFGLLLSVGATKKQIIKSVFFEATIVGIIGIAIGIIGSYIGIGTVLLVINELLKDFMPYNFELATYPLFILIPTIFSILTVYISAYLPAITASRISPISVIRQNDDYKLTKRNVKTSPFVNKIFGFEADLALKNIKRNKKKYRITIVSLFISIVAFITFSSFFELTNKAIKIIDVPDYSISIGKRASKGEKVNYANVINSDDVSDYYNIKIINGLLIDINDDYKKEYKEEVDKEKTSMVSIIGLTNRDYIDYQKQVNINNDNPILYNYYKTTIYSQQGDKNKMVKKSGKITDKRVINLSIKGYDIKNSTDKSIFYHVDSNIISNTNLVSEAPSFYSKSIGDNVLYLFVNEDTFNKLLDQNIKYNNDDKYNDNMLIYAKNTNNLEKIIKTDIEANYYDNFDNVAKNTKMIKNSIIVLEILIYGLITLVTLIGITSVFNTINTSMNLRRREFAVLRSVGLEPSGFRKMILFESLIFGFKSLLYGLPVALFISSKISATANEVILTNAIPYKQIGLSIIGVFVVVLMTMIYATNKIRNENILEAIRNENI